MWRPRYDADDGRPIESSRWCRTAHRRVRRHRPRGGGSGTRRRRGPGARYAAPPRRRRRAPGGRARPGVAFVEWVDPLMAGGNWVPELVAIAGGTTCSARPASIPWMSGTTWCRRPRRDRGDAVRVRPRPRLQGCRCSKPRPDGHASKPSATAGPSSPTATPTSTAPARDWSMPEMLAEMLHPEVAGTMHGDGLGADGVRPLA